MIAEKKYRLDLNLWETKHSFIWGLITFYSYSLFQKKTKYRLFKIKNAKYFVFQKYPKVKMTREAFNEWVVSIWGKGGLCGAEQSNLMNIIELE